MMATPRRASQIYNDELTSLMREIDLRINDCRSLMTKPESEEVRGTYLFVLFPAATTTSRPYAPAHAALAAVRRSAG